MNTKDLETSVSDSALRQIHVAIQLLQISELESAITLAAAAEGMMPATETPHLFSKLKLLADGLPVSEPGAKGPNDYAVWLKHGEAVGKKFDRAVIAELEAIAMIARAVSKYSAVYGGITPQMGAFRDWAINRIQAEAP